ASGATENQGASPCAAAAASVTKKKLTANSHWQNSALRIPHSEFSRQGRPYLSPNPDQNATRRRHWLLVRAQNQRLTKAKNKCKNLLFSVDTTAYLIKSLRMTNETRIKIVKRNGKNVALYNTKLVTGEWYKFWFKTTLAEAKQMLASGKA